jgi:hypothetical protein
VCVQNHDVEVEPGFDDLPRWSIEELIKLKATDPGQQKDQMIDAINHIKVVMPSAEVL